MGSVSMNAENISLLIVEVYHIPAVRVTSTQLLAGQISADYSYAYGATAKLNGHSPGQSVVCLSSIDIVKTLPVPSPHSYRQEIMESSHPDPLCNQTTLR